MRLHNLALAITLGLPAAGCFERPQPPAVPDARPDAAGTIHFGHKLIDAFSKLPTPISCDEIRKTIQRLVNEGGGETVLFPEPGKCEMCSPNYVLGDGKTGVGVVHGRISGEIHRRVISVVVENTSTETDPEGGEFNGFVSKPCFEEIFEGESAPIAPIRKMRDTSL